MTFDDLKIYIYCPPWRDWSAGVKVQHYLCHHLNGLGIDSYIAPTDERYLSSYLNSALKTKLLSKQTLQAHRRDDKTVVAVYSESIIGNPLGVLNRIRWFLNFPSLLGGDNRFSGEYIWAYDGEISKALISDLDIQARVVFIPSIDDSEAVELYESRIPMNERNGFDEIIYAQKFRMLGGKPKPISLSFKEIKRGRNIDHAHNRTMQYLRNAKIAHVYENTTLITEAQLLDVPVFLEQNPHFSVLIAGTELAIHGASWDVSKILAPNPEETLNCIKVANKNISSILSQSVLELLPSLVAGSENAKLPSGRYINMHSLTRTWGLFRNNGFKTVMRFLLFYVTRK